MANRNRDMLHILKLEEFKTWAESIGWKEVASPPSAVWEVLRLQKDDKLAIFWQRARNHFSKGTHGGSDHITTSGHSTTLVHMWFKHRRLFNDSGEASSHVAGGS